MKRFLTGAAAWALGVGTFALIVPAGAQSLTDALVLAYQNNPALGAQRARLRAQDEEVAVALSGWHPTVTLNGTAGRQSNTRVFASGGGSAVTGNAAGGGGGLVETTAISTPRTSNITVTQSLYKGGKIEAQTRIADFNVLVERSRLQLVEQQTLDAAAGAYVDVVRDEAVLALNDNNVQVLTRQLEATRDQFAAGTVTRTDVSQAEAALSKAQADREAAQNQLQVSRANFRNVIGILPNQLSDPGEPTGLPANRDEAFSQAPVQNPNVLVAVYTERSAIANVDLQFGGLLPSLSLQGLLSKTTETFSRQDDTELAQLLLVLSVPLYTGGVAEAQVREAKQTVNQRLLELEQARRQAIQDATTAWENLQSARAQERSFQDQIKADEVALDGVQQEQRAGLRTILDVLNAEQALLTARVSYVGAHHDAIKAGYDLLSAIGRLTARDRQLPVEYYDPTAHYKETRGKWFGTGEPLQ